MKTANVEKKLKDAGFEKTAVPGRRDAWKKGAKLVWHNEGDSYVHVGYAHAPGQQGQNMNLSTLLKLA